MLLYYTLNFERQYGSSLQIVVQKEVLDCILLDQTQFQTPRRRSFKVFLYEKEAGAACEKGLRAKQKIVKHSGQFLVTVASKL